MPTLLTVPPIKFFKMQYGGRLQTAVGYIEFNNEPYKIRCETLIFNKKNELFLLKVNKPWKYELPGGTVELEAEKYADSPSTLTICLSIANNENLEESMIITKDLEYSYTYRIYKYEDNGNNKWQKKLEKEGFKVVGDISLIYTAKYLGKYSNKIEEIDEYKEMKQNGTFYSLNKVKNILEPEHLQLWNKFIKKDYIDPLDVILE